MNTMSTAISCTPENTTSTAQHKKRVQDLKVAVLFAGGFEEVEALIPVDVLRRGNVHVDMVAVGEELNQTSSHQITLQCDLSIDEAELDAYDLVVLPGGIPGTPNLKANKKVVDTLKSFANEAKPIAAICAAPSILAEEGLLKGKTATANPGFQHVIEENGAILSHGSVVVDGNFITSQGAGTAFDFAFAILRYLTNDELVQNVKAGVVYQ